MCHNRVSVQSHDRAIDDLQRSCNSPCRTNEAKTQIPRNTLIEGRTIQRQTILPQFPTHHTLSNTYKFHTRVQILGKS